MIIETWLVCFDDFTDDELATTAISWLKNCPGDRSPWWPPIADLRAARKQPVAQSRWFADSSVDVERHLRNGLGAFILERYARLPNEREAVEREIRATLFGPAWPYDIDELITLWRGFALTAGKPTR